MGVEKVRVAVVQMDVQIENIPLNFQRIIEKVDEAASWGAQLIVFPECSTSGYCFASLKQAVPFAIEASREIFQDFLSACKQLDVTVVLGFIEKDGENYYNSAILARPDETFEIYRKTHLPTLGIDRFLAKGDNLAVYDTPVGKVGLLICYDIRFPEAARSLGLQGADIIALPTNWPQGAESSPDFITRGRAWESRVYVLAANRVGVERGRKFIGRSQIISPTGQILHEAGSDEETILYEDLDLSICRQKRIVNEPGEWELDITADRRPELYTKLTECNS